MSNGEEEKREREKFCWKTVPFTEGFIINFAIANCKCKCKCSLATIISRRRCLFVYLIREFCKVTKLQYFKVTILQIDDDWTAGRSDCVTAWNLCSLETWEIAILPVVLCSALLCHARIVGAGARHEKSNARHGSFPIGPRCAVCGCVDTIHRCVTATTQQCHNATAKIPRKLPGGRNTRGTRGTRGTHGTPQQPWLIFASLIVVSFHFSVQIQQQCTHSEDSKRWDICVVVLYLCIFVSFRYSCIFGCVLEYT